MQKQERFPSMDCVERFPHLWEIWDIYTTCTYESCPHVSFEETFLKMFKLCKFEKTHLYFFTKKISSGQRIEWVNSLIFGESKKFILLVRMKISSYFLWRNLIGSCKFEITHHYFFAKIQDLFRPMNLVGIFLPFW